MCSFKLVGIGSGYSGTFEHASDNGLLLKAVASPSGAMCTVAGDDVRVGIGVVVDVVVGVRAGGGVGGGDRGAVLAPPVTSVTLTRATLTFL